jgi:hypothetical protein
MLFLQNMQIMKNHAMYLGVEPHHTQKDKPKSALEKVIKRCLVFCYVEEIH